MSGLTLNKAWFAGLAQEVAVDEAAKAAAEAAADKAREIARNEAYGTETHYLKSGYEVNPGDYMNSIEARQTDDGTWYLVAGDFKAWWIEYGSIHNPEVATLRRAVTAAGYSLTGGRRG